MAKRTSPRRVGAFVLGALAIIVIAIAALGSGQLFRKTREYVCFFDGSVNGLRTGAAVKFKGVRIGEVKSILLSLDVGHQTANVQTSSVIRIPVIIEIDQSRMESRGLTNIDLGDPNRMKLAIDRGLRAQLAIDSLLTGMLYIDLDMHPGAPSRLVLPPNSGYDEIPTLPTTFQQAQNAAARLIGQIDRIQVDQLVNTATQTLAAVRDLANSTQLRSAISSLQETGQSLNRAANEIQQLTANMNQQIGPMSKSVQITAHNTDATLQTTQLMMMRVNNTLAPDGPLLYQTNQTLLQLAEAARSVRRLADYLDRNPDALVRGRSYKQAGQ